MGGVGGCSFGELEARVNNVELMWNQASNEQVLIQVLDHLERLLADVSQQDTFTDEEKQLREEMEEVVWTRYVLLLSQLGRTAEASSMLSQRGYSHMLSTEIFQNRATSFSRSSRVEQERSLDSSNPRCSEISHSSRASDRSQVNPDQDEIIQVYFRDDALPGTVWDQLLIAFGVESPFWREHNYEDPSTGFRCGVVGSMETSHCRCPRAHQPVLPCENCVMHENCGHSQKYHPAGHELHFDSVPDDSGNDVRTPLVSTVSICHAIDLRQDNVRPKRSMQSGKRLKCLGAPQVTFLSASVGGMTVVTDQSLSSTGLARTGHAHHAHGGFLGQTRAHRCACASFLGRVSSQWLLPVHACFNIQTAILAAVQHGALMQQRFRHRSAEPRRSSGWGDAISMVVDACNLAGKSPSGIRISARVIRTARGTTEQEERRETEEPEARKERRGEEDGVEAGRVSEDVHVGSGGQGASAAQQIESLMSGPEGCGLFVSARTSHPDACEVADESDSEMEDA
eukprot:840728-Rhodomonas_salina.1